MASPSTSTDPLASSIVTPPASKPKLPQPSVVGTSSPLKPDVQTPTTATPPPPPPSSDADVVHIPSYSRWFSWNSIHECEMRFLPEFFDWRSPSKNPNVYTYYRNSIIKRFRQNPLAKITFTEVRKTLVGDVGSIRRVFDFLEAWGLINYSPSVLNKPLKWEDKDVKPASQAVADGGGSSLDSTPPNKESSKRFCTGCKSVCTIACFACDKYDLTLCARCYVRGNYRVGINSADFRRVEISEEMRTDWTEKETLQLMEAIMHYGNDWRKVAQYVGGNRSEKDCIMQFIKLPFGEEFASYTDPGEVDNSQIKDHNGTACGLRSIGSSSPNKKMHLTPLADASNPIMAQAAFLSALAGVEVAEAAAQAALRTLSDVEYGPSKGNHWSLARNSRQQGADASNGDAALNTLERACLGANSQLEEEETEVERSICSIAEMKGIQDKIARFEELDMQMEKEWQQLEQMKNLLFVDQLTLLFHKNSPRKTGERMEDNMITD